MPRGPVLLQMLGACAVLLGLTALAGWAWALLLAGAGAVALGTLAESAPVKAKRRPAADDD